MTIPDAAIEAAAEALRRSRRTYADMACAALEAAMPALEQHFREALAQEIEAKITKPKSIWDDDGHHRQHNYKEAARIVRGGTP